MESPLPLGQCGCRNGTPSSLLWVIAVRSRQLPGCVAAIRPPISDGFNHRARPIVLSSRMWQLARSGDAMTPLLQTLV